jgi:tRNA pseudouridine55 synthase
MATLLRTRQATYTTCAHSESLDSVPAITYTELDAGEDIWGPKIRPQLESWVAANPVGTGHVNGRSEETKRKKTVEQSGRPKQRFRGGFIADTKQERIKQQGGKYKGKWSRKPVTDEPTKDGERSTVIDGSQRLHQVEN